MGTHEQASMLERQIAKAADAGSCNFCTREGYRTVMVVRSSDPLRHMEVRFCMNCLTDLCRNIRR